MSKADRDRRYHANQKSKGLCSKCPEPIFKASRCAYHYKKYYTDGGRCWRCGVKLIVDKQHITCMNCRDNNVRKEIAWNLSKNDCPTPTR